MLELRHADENAPHLNAIIALYEGAFPANERRPLEPLLCDKTGAGEVFAALDGDRFVGMLALLTHGDITHIIYFAVEPALRRRGYGSQLLKAVRRLYPQNRIVADVEAPKPGSANATQREKRIDFYRRNGYAVTDIRYHWEDEDYWVMALGGDVSGSEFGAFWRYFYSLNAGYDY